MPTVIIRAPRLRLVHLSVLVRVVAGLVGLLLILLHVLVVLIV